MVPAKHRAALEAQAAPCPLEAQSAAGPPRPRQVCISRFQAAWGSALLRTPSPGAKPGTAGAAPVLPSAAPGAGALPLLLAWAFASAPAFPLAPGFPSAWPATAPGAPAKRQAWSVSGGAAARRACHLLLLP